MKRHVLWQFGTAMFFAGILAAQDPSSIRNFLRVNEKVCTGGQPTLEELAALKQQGIRAVINLRQPTEYNAAEEEAKVRELGLRYIHIPVATADPKPEQVDEFLRVTDDPANQPAFIHCGSANRVGAFWMIRRVLRDGWNLEDAEREARKIGLRSQNLYEFALDYIRRHKKAS
ncbi:MAG: protein tyrosine phosphatase family protein [Firmicutes bacterium]|nr:protein tyrosine phosphatase family protein [Bacillota bacterium]